MRVDVEGSDGGWGEGERGKETLTERRVGEAGEVSLSETESGRYVRGWGGGSSDREGGWEWWNRVRFQEVCVV